MLLFGIATFMSACTGPKLALDKDKVSFNQLLDFIDTEQNKIKSLKASCRITVDSEAFSGNFFADVYYIDNDSLLLSVRGPFGIQAGTLFIGKERFIFYNQLSNKFYNGTIKDFQNSNFFQFPLSLQDLTNIFVAKEDLPSMKIKNYDIEDDLYLINAENGKDNYNIWIDHSTGHIRKLIVERNNRVLFSREYSNFAKAAGIYFPRKIDMLRPEERQAVSVFYTNFTLNDTIEREKFIINIADHAEQIYFPR